MAYKIRDWEKHFERDRSKQWTTLKWVPIPNKQGAGYRRIMSEKNGLEIFACWIALIQTASLCSPRGDLSKYSLNDLSRLTLCDIKKLEAAIYYLSQTLDWIEVINILDINVNECQKDVCQSSIDSSILSNSILSNSSLKRANKLSYFDEFWKIYPKKVGKGAAEKAWNKIKSPVETLEKIKQTLLWQIKSTEWIKEEGQYIPMPASYLNQRRWEDEPKTKQTTITKKVSKISSEEHAALMAEIKHNAATPSDIDNLILGISKKIKDV